MNEVALRGDDYIIERAGKPLVAMIPIEKYRKLQKDMDEFYALVMKFRNGTEVAAPQEIEELIEEAVTASKTIESKRAATSSRKQ